MTETLPVTRKYYILEKDGTISFTAAGIDYYLPYFDKLGIDIANVTTMKRLAIASRLVRALRLEEIEQSVAEMPKNLESRWLLSLLQGDDMEHARLDDILIRAREHRLHIVR